MLQQFLLHSFQNETDCHFVLLKHAPTCALFLLPTSALTIAEYVTSWRRATITSPRKGSWVFGEDGVSSCILGEDHVADNWPLTSSANTHQPCYTGLCLQKLIFLPLFTKAALMVRTLASVDKSRSCFIWTEIYMTGEALRVPGSVRWGAPRGSGCQYPLRIADWSNETGSGSGHRLKSSSSCF